MRTYSAKQVEAITGISGALLRQWEKRGLYVCHLRSNSQFQLRLMVSGDKPERLQNAAETLKKLNTGWRAFTYEDLFRLTLIRKASELGIEIKKANELLSGLSLDGEEVERDVWEVESRPEFQNGPQFFAWSPEFPFWTSGTVRGYDRFQRQFSGRTISIVFNLTEVRAQLFAAIDKMNAGAE